MKGGQSNRFFCGLQNPAVDMLSSLSIKTPILRFPIYGKSYFVYGKTYPLVVWKALDSVGLALNLFGQDDVPNIAIPWRLRSMVSDFSTSLLIRERN